jgi:hypothetical protein
MVAQIGSFARSTGIEVISLPVKASTTITRGKGVEQDANGFAIAGTASGTVALGLYCAIETVDNSAGADGAKTVRCASGNSFVYMEAGGAINFGHTVKFDANADCVATTSAPDTKTFGRFIAHENESVTPTDASDGDTIIVRLGL